MGVIAQQSIRGTIVTYLGVAVGFVTTFLVLTRFLTAEEIGLVRVLTDAAILFVGLAQLGTSNSIIRFFPYFKDQAAESHGPNTDDSSSQDAASSSHNHGFFLWTIVVPLVGFALFALLYWACRTPLSAWFGDKSPMFVNYYYMVLPIAFFMLYQTIFETNSNVLMSIVVPRAVRELGVRVGLLIIYLLYAGHLLSLDGMVWALCANYLVAALINLGYLLSLGRISWRPDWMFLRQHSALIRQYLTYTLFLIVSAVASVLAPTLSSFFITAHLGLSYTGVFAIATYMAVMVSIPYRSVTAIASPQLSDAISRGQMTETSQLVQKVVSNLLLIGSVILLAIWINIDIIFAILPNGETYIPARQVVLYLSLSQLILAAGSIGLTALNYSRFYAFSLLYSALLTGSSIALNSWLVPRLGMEGAALSNLLSYALYIALILLTIRLCSGIRWMSRSVAYTCLLLTVLLLINQLWTGHICIGNIWTDSILRSILLLGALGAGAHMLHLSPEIDGIIRQKISRISKNTPTKR